MYKSWKTDKAWSDQYLSEIRRIVTEMVGEIMTIRVAGQREDQKRATDYIVESPSGDIACRIRRPTKYRDLTIRYMRPSGHETEYQKIVKGYARWYLYAWAKDNQFEDWIFVDLDKLRGTDLLPTAQIQKNPDGVQFKCIPVVRLQKEGCILRMSEHLRT